MCWIEAEEGDNGDGDWIGKERHETPLKTYCSSSWAKLPGLGGRVWIIKLTNSVYTLIFASTKQLNCTETGDYWGLNEIPVLFPAEKALTGPVPSLTHVGTDRIFQENSMSFYGFL